MYPIIKREWILYSTPDYTYKIGFFEKILSLFMLATFFVCRTVNLNKVYNLNVKKLFGFRYRLLQIYFGQLVYKIPPTHSTILLLKKNLLG